MDKEKESVPEFGSPDWSRILTPDSSPVSKVIETHCSWVMLAGSTAYKVKKPVQLGFLNYSTLARRYQACRRELEVNRPFAPQLYHDVVAVTQSPEGWRVEGDGKIVDYAVKMTRFEDDLLLSTQLENGQVEVRQMQSLADQIIAYHTALPPVTRTGSGPTVASLSRPMLLNFEYLEDHLTSSHVESISKLREWACDQLNALAPQIEQRISGGYIRPCHGDLHLENLIVWHNRFVAFDAIEFNDSFREIDVVNELAFLAMDLEDRGHFEHAHELLNHYFEQTLDYQALPLLRLYQVYRALVRAKVDLIQQLQHTGQERGEWSDKGAAYLELAKRFAMPEKPRLFMTHGLSGSGKSTFARSWIRKHGGFQLRSDALRRVVEKERLHTQSPATSPARDSQEASPARYSQEVSEATYARLTAEAKAILEAGYSVFADATYLKKWQRKMLFDMARELGTHVEVIDFDVSHEILRQRILDRHNDLSEATTEVLESQIQSQERLTEDEQVAIIETIRD